MKWLKRTLATFCILIAAICSIIIYVQLSGSRYIQSSEKIQPRTVALILGASVSKIGIPSDALVDRVETGILLYKEKKVQKLLMTGDDGQFHVNEVEAMQRLALNADVTSSSIVLDGHGYRTYESCKRAKQEFGINEAIIITQRFHLPRALYICRNFGINAVGISADKRAYKNIISFTIRDWFASAKAWWDINVQAPKSPVKKIDDEP